MNFKPRTSRGEGPVRFRAPDPRASRRLFFIFLLGVALVGWAYVVLASEVFMVSRIEVTGLKTLDPLDVSREALDIIDHQPRPFWHPVRHAWFINREKLAAELKTRLFTERVEIEKSYTNVLRLKLEERSRKSILHSHQQYFWLDLHGLITEELSPSERKAAQARLLGQNSNLDNVPIIHRDLDETITPGYRVAEATDVSSWLELTSEITKQGIPYREIEPPPNSSSTRAVITSSDNLPVWIDTHDSLEAQLNAYRIFQEQRIKNKIAVKEYIDVRIPGKVYVK